MERTPSGSTALDTLLLAPRLRLGPGNPCVLGAGLWASSDPTAPPSSQPVGAPFRGKPLRHHESLVSHVFCPAPPNSRPCRCPSAIEVSVCLLGRLQACRTRAISAARQLARLCKKTGLARACANRACADGHITEGRGLCRRAILASSGNAIRGLRVFTQPLAEAASADGRKGCVPGPRSCARMEASSQIRRAAGPGKLGVLRDAPRTPLGRCPRC